MLKSMIALWLGCLLNFFALMAIAQTNVSFPSLSAVRPSNLTAYLRQPEGSGPFPAIVLAHPCGGINAVVRNWSNFFIERGYATLIVDSFASRSISEVCTRGGLISLDDRAGDLLGGLQYLQSLSFVQKSRIGLIGFSHGAAAVLAAVSESRKYSLGDTPDFAASIAMYPDCLQNEVDSRVPLLIQSGEKDDWTAAIPCQRKVAERKSEGYPVGINVYKNAYHSFDNPQVRYYYGPTFRNPNKPKFCCGASLGYDATAHHQAEKAAEDFFASLLKPNVQSQTALWIPKPEPNHDDVIQLTHEAMAYATENGIEKLVELINSENSKFRRRRIFLIILDQSGQCLAHGQMPDAYKASDFFAKSKDAENRENLDVIRSALQVTPPWGAFKKVRGSEDFYVERLDNDHMVIGVLMR